MKIIKIAPHHAREYFEVYFLNRKPGEGNGWYNDEKFKQNSEATIMAVVQDPSQLVQIVSDYDSFCRMCPRNPRGENYAQPENTCTIYEVSDNGNELELAKDLGICDLIGKPPMTSEAFFKKMKQTYKKLLTEREDGNSSKYYSLRQYFRFEPKNLSERFYEVS